MERKYFITIESGRVIKNRTSEEIGVDRVKQEKIHRKKEKIMAVRVKNQQSRAI